MMEGPCENGLFFYMPDGADNELKPVSEHYSGYGSFSARRVNRFSLSGITVKASSAFDVVFSEDP